MAFPFPPLVQRLQEVVPPEAQVHLVGGTVRDALRGRASHDVDLVAPAHTLRLARQIADALGAAFYPLDPQRGIGRVVFTSPQGERLLIDLAAYRGPTLEDDLRGRDFTINALAVPLHHPDRLIDPTHGLQDLKDNILRACSPTAFADDPVRILRAPRLAAALGLRIEPLTRGWMQQAVPLLEDVSPERLRDELFRILSGPKPTAPLKALDAITALDYVLPELPRLHGRHLPWPHTADAWAAAMRTVDALTALLAALDPVYDQEKAADFALGFAMVRIGRYRQALAEHLRRGSHPERPLAALLALAALFQYTAEEPAPAAQAAATRGQALRLSNAEIRRWRTMVRYHRLPEGWTARGRLPSRREIYRYFRATGEAGVDVALLSLAAMLARYGPRLPHDRWQAHLETVRSLLAAWWEQREEVVAPRPLLNGEDLIREVGARPGPLLGQVLEALREAQAAGEVREREQALRWAAAWLEARQRDA